MEKIKEDSNAILMIPEEVKVELDVQLLAEIPPKPNERQRILDAVNDCQIVYEKSTREIENKLRELSAILKLNMGRAFMKNVNSHRNTCKCRMRGF